MRFGRSVATEVTHYRWCAEYGRDGRKFRTLNVIDKFIREEQAIRLARQLKATEVIDVLADLFITRGTPVLIRSDNGPWLAATAALAPAVVIATVVVTVMVLEMPSANPVAEVAA